MSTPPLKKSFPPKGGEPRPAAPSPSGAVAQIEVRRAGDKVWLEVTGANPEAVVLIQQFVGALNGRALDVTPGNRNNKVFGRPVHLASVGFDDEGKANSIALEADPTKVVLHVDERHQNRAAAFCQRHRHTTTTEAMDDLAAEFERVAREANADALRRLANVCRDRAALAIEGVPFGESDRTGAGKDE